MQILLIYTCTDPYSHEEFHLQRTLIEGDYSKNDLSHMKQEYLASFSAKRTSKLSITHLDVSPTGEVTVLDNIQGEHPLKVRREINPAAVQAKEARSKKVVTPKLSEDSPGWVTVASGMPISNIWNTSA